MISPVVIPLPAALAAIAALAVLAYAAQQWLEGNNPISFTYQPKTVELIPLGGRHRLVADTEQYRPRYIGERVAPPQHVERRDPADIIADLAPPSRRLPMQIAGHDDHTIHLPDVFTEETEELSAVS